MVAILLHVFIAERNKFSLSLKICYFRSVLADLFWFLGYAIKFQKLKIYFCDVITFELLPQTLLPLKKGSNQTVEDTLQKETGRQSIQSLQIASREKGN